MKQGYNGINIGAMDYRTAKTITTLDSMFLKNIKILYKFSKLITFKIFNYILFNN